MKGFVAALIVLSLIFTASACGKSEPRDISCDEIIHAYGEAGYSNVFHRHGSENGYEEECYIIVYQDKALGSDLVQIRIFKTESEASEAAESNGYNAILWMMGIINGEGRWLKSGYYGKVEYSSYNSEMLQPLEDLMQ